MMEKPHVKDLIIAVRQLAVEHPTNVYLKANPTIKRIRGNCSYTKGKCSGDREDDEEGCIFGRGFRRIGFTVPVEPRLYSKNENAFIIGKRV